MLRLQQFEQVLEFDPMDPTQRRQEVYAGIPGEYVSYYFNEQPVSGGALMGVSSFFQDNWKKIALVGILAGGVGAYCWNRRR